MTAYFHSAMNSYERIKDSLIPHDKEHLYQDVSMQNKVRRLNTVERAS